MYVCNACILVWISHVGSSRYRYFERAEEGGEPEAQPFRAHETASLIC